VTNSSTCTVYIHIIPHTCLQGHCAGRWWWCVRVSICWLPANWATCVLWHYSACVFTHLLKIRI